MELVGRAGRDMATRADIGAAVRSMQHSALRTLMFALLPVYLGLLGSLGSVIGLSVTR